MCESAVYLMEEGDRRLVMREAARISVVPEGVVCIGILGEEELVEDAELVEANLVRHEIVLRRREG